MLLKLHPFQHDSIRPAAQSKLSPKYFSPYLVLENIGSVAYCLDISPGSLVHPTFHVSLLKKAHGIVHTIHPLPSVDHNYGLLYIPEAIVERKLAKRNNKVAVKVLVRWQGCPLTNATWEFLDDW